MVYHIKRKNDGMLRVEILKMNESDLSMDTKIINK